MFNFTSGSRILFLGEGNFSFSANYVKNIQECKNFGCIYATCFERRHDGWSTAKIANVKYLEDQGVNVLHDVDATKLDNDDRFQCTSFDKVIFMFPHTGGKMKIHLNRNLLRGVFESCTTVLSTNGELLITLCKGQGGTPGDPEQRRQDDTWKILDISQDSGYVMTNLEKFPVDHFEDYSQVGYRSLQKAFNVQDAMVHVFKYFPIPDFEILKNRTESCVVHGLKHVNKEDEREASLQLYPLVHKHHLSFWYEKPISNEDILDVAILCLGDIIQDVTFVSGYEKDGRKSQTVEITYKSRYYPLGPSQSFRVHMILGKSLEKLFNVELR